MATTRTADEASPSSSSPSSKHWTYDVFLSFRGEDTRLGFTDNLYMTLKEAGINTFLDDTELRRGENIAEELIRAIQQSKISVIVFSRKYAESRWCLEELVKIMECRRTLRQTVLPIFYYVDPSDVRKQTGTLAEAFDQKHKDKDEDKVKRWRAALTEAANLSGWDLRNAADGHEGLFVRKIRDEITWHLLNRTPLHVAEHQVGIDSRMQDIIFHLGVGFQASSFLANVRETSKESKGKVTMQNKFLSDILSQTKTVVDDIDKGINVIKEKIGCRSVLVVVDDVDQLDQLHDLAIDPDLFGPGSRIIVTTRDKQLLEHLQVDTIYAAREMNEEESLEFFSLHAFKTRFPNEEYADLSRTVVDYCGGLPLAIKVLGSFLFRRSTSFWESTIKKLGMIPHLEIQEKLKLSFDGLNDETEKDIFLDIVFLYWNGLNHVKQILEGCGFFPDSGIEVLIQRCLVTVSETNEMGMHDLIRDMGRAIVWSKSPQDPGKRCRLWDDADATDVLRNKSGSEAIEGLTLKMLTSDAKASFSTKAFSKMKRLRLLKLNHVQLSGGYKFFSNKLCWLCWHGFPLKSVPKDFSLQNVVAMDLQYSKLIHLWEDSRLLEKLEDS
ncbi:hypothetical protein ACLB2K_044976 [Fragaria x ananassa]